ncbi:MAG TPA: hypothetical protein DCO77_13730 [Nitrospiraceae bacterium]|nr:hypothetical protein [Nitrospiraceae bacterium]
MIKSIKLLSLFVILFSLILTSCASTKLTGSWKDEQYTGTVKKVLIIGMSKKPTVKRLFEMEFDRQFKARGIDAVSGFRVLPPEFKPDKAVLLSTVKELNVNAVLITRVMDKKTVDRHYPRGVYVSYPGYYNDMHDFYGRSYQYVAAPSYSYEQDVVYLETNVYDAVTEKMIWAALSKTFPRGAVKKEISTFVEIMMKKMAADKILE